MYPSRDPVAVRRVQFMATCLCDVFFDDVARAAVEVLERLGCEVEFPADQTCCGQPGYTAGSCAAAIFHEAAVAFEGEPDHAEMLALGRRTWEFTDFIVNGLGQEQWPGRLDARIVAQDHLRGALAVGMRRPKPKR